MSKTLFYQGFLIFGQPFDKSNLFLENSLSYYFHFLLFL